MLRDFDYNQQTEHEHILDSMVHYAKSLGTPCIKGILSYTQMAIRDRERSKSMSHK
jgi:ketopantoate reductase